MDRPRSQLVRGRYAFRKIFWRNPMLRFRFAERLAHAYKLNSFDFMLVISR